MPGRRQVVVVVVHVRHQRVGELLSGAVEAGAGAAPVGEVEVLDVGQAVREQRGRHPVQEDVSRGGGGRQLPAVRGLGGGAEVHALHQGVAALVLLPLQPLLH